MITDKDPHQFKAIQAESSPNYSQNFVINTLMLFFGMKSFFWLLDSVILNDKTLIIDSSIFIICAASLFIIGFLTGLILLAIDLKVPEEQHGLLFISLFFLLIFSEILYTQSCIPAIFMRNIFTIPKLIPVIIGYKISFFINKKISI